MRITRKILIYNTFTDILHSCAVSRKYLITRNTGQAKTSAKVTDPAEFL